MAGTEAALMNVTVADAIRQHARTSTYRFHTSGSCYSCTVLLKSPEDIYPCTDGHMRCKDHVGTFGFTKITHLDSWFLDLVVDADI